MAPDESEQPSPELVAAIDAAIEEPLQRARELRNAAEFPRGAEPSGTVPIADRSFHFGNQAHSDYVRMVSTDDAFMLASHWGICSRQQAPTEALHAQAVAQAGWWASISDASWAETEAKFEDTLERWSDAGAPRLDDVRHETDHDHDHDADGQ